jgi:hypothetical protein
MDKLFMVVAVEPNNIEVPCRFSTEEESLETFLKELFPECTLIDNKMALYDLQDDDPRFHEVFTGFYGGCGAPGKFIIKPVELDTKVVHWDLD